MHIFRCLCLATWAFLMILMAGALCANPAANLSIDALSAVLMDVDTGLVLYEKNPHQRLPNASTTKIMTAILLIEHCDMADRIEASKNASETPYTSLHLKPGETITAKDLLTGMLVRSANDASVAAAEHIAGSTDSFAKVMNVKAASLGCKNTNFVTPNGLHDPDHYSSAYDLCLITRYALRYPMFNEAIKTRKYLLNSRTINKEDLCVYSHSKFLRSYPGADGVKSGYTKQSRTCYVGSATRNGRRLVSAILGSPNANAETALLMDYGFNNFEPRRIAAANQKCGEADVKGGRSSTVSARAAKELIVPVAKGDNITTKLVFTPVEAPITKGTPVGRMIAMAGGRQVAVVELAAGENVGISLARRAMSIVKGCGMLVACLIVGGYGRKIAKSARRRRRRITAPVRGYNRRR